jgi:uncharacterized protein with ATP-grasp and redox domains
MKTYLECIPCFFRQALEAARMSGVDDKTQKQILDEVAKAIPGFPLSSTPPEMGKTIHDIVKRMTGKPDPYRQLKERATQKALAIYPELKEKTETAADRLRMAIELAIAGNIIDYGSVNALDVEKELEKILQREQLSIGGKDHSVFDFDSFKNANDEARTVLYLGDNVGETVFDRVLLEEIKRIDPEKDITYAVREKPIINDALIDDAIAAGIDRVARVSSSGSEVPGTILSLCSKPFIERFEKADMVISKGQGNYETLSDESRPIYFLFMAKCPVIARDLGCAVGEIVLTCNQNFPKPGSR